MGGETLDTANPRPLITASDHNVYNLAPKLGQLRVLDARSVQ